MKQYMENFTGDEWVINEIGPEEVYGQKRRWKRLSDPYKDEYEYECWIKQIWIEDDDGNIIEIEELEDGLESLAKLSL